MSQVPRSTIKTNIKTLLDAANTTTGSPVDLSYNLDTRVRRVLKIDPARITIQPSEYPFVAIHIPSIDYEPLTIGHGSQASALRRATVNVNIVAACYEPYFNDLTIDEGDENTEQLLQNIQEILRSTPTLNVTSTAWAMPVREDNFGVNYGEEALLKAGVLNLTVKVHY